MGVKIANVDKFLNLLNKNADQLKTLGLRCIDRDKGDRFLFAGVTIQYLLELIGTGDFEIDE